MKLRRITYTTSKCEYNPELKLGEFIMLGYDISHFDDDTRELYVDVLSEVLEFNTFPLTELKNFGVDIVPIYTDYIASRLPYRTVNFRYMDTKIYFTYLDILFSIYTKPNGRIIVRFDPHNHLTFNYYGDFIYLMSKISPLLRTLI